MNIKNIPLWIAAFLIILATVLTLAGCGEDTGNTDTSYRERIIACINDGGKPEYTAYQNGDVADYFGCVYP